MLRIVSVLLVFSCALAAPRNQGPVFLPQKYDGNPQVPMLDGYIVGGQVVPIASFPFSASLRIGNSHSCGSSIISTTWILTAAHCVVGQSVNSLSIRVGSQLHASGGTLYAISGGFLHGSYSSSTLDYDIAVISVSSSLSFGTNVQSINLATQGSRPSAGTNSVVSGWGTTSEGGSLSAQLQAVTVPIVSQAACQAAYGSSAITDRMLCAGVTAGGLDACQGDSGGPLVIASTVVGIVSWGNGCARPNFPGVYTNVGTLRSWVQSAAGV